MSGDSAEKDLRRELTLLGWFVEKGISFNSVDSPYFREYHDISSWIRPPSRKRLAVNLLRNLYNMIMERNKERMKQADYFAITSDAWTSDAQQKFVGLTAHFLTPDFRMESLCLAVIPLAESHSWINLTEAVAARIMDAVPDHAILTTCVTDNGANFIKMARSLMTNMIVAVTEDEDLDSWDEPLEDNADELTGTCYYCYNASKYLLTMNT